MSNPTRIGQEAPDLKTPSSPSRITPTRALVVGAGGNVGAVAWGLMFMFGSSGPQGYRHLGIIIILSAFLTLGINIRGAGSLFRNDMDSTIERRARGDDDDESFHTASALTPSSLASV